jgi:hypothetical protein
VFNCVRAAQEFQPEFILHHERDILLLLRVLAERPPLYHLGLDVSASLK